MLKNCTADMMPGWMLLRIHLMWIVILWLAEDDENEAPSSGLLSSCEAILSKWPNSPSGYYSLVNVNILWLLLHAWRLCVVKVEVG